MAYLFPTLPVLAFVLSGKGGVGKSLFSLLLADLFELNAAPLGIMQIDDQDRLAHALGREISTVDIKLLKKARKDSSIITKVLAELFSRIEDMPVSGNNTLVDIGATQQHLLYEYASLIELDEDLVEFGVQAIAFILVTADPEAIEQAVKQIEALAMILPSVKPCVVLNERDGKFGDMASGSDAARIFGTRLEPYFNSVSQITMPKIEAGSWAHFERQHCSMIDVVGYDVAKTMNVSGLSRPEAKLARGDVAAFLDVMEEQIFDILPLAAVDDNA